MHQVLARSPAIELRIASRSASFSRQLTQGQRALWGSLVVWDDSRFRRELGMNCSVRQREHVKEHVKGVRNLL